MTKPLKVRRTLIARAKLKEIYAYSYGRWGEETATQYLTDIETVIQQAAVDYGGTNRNVKFSRRFTYSLARKHFIFFEVKKDTLFVATVFHGVMDIKNRLAEEMNTIQREIDERRNNSCP